MSSFLLELRSEEIPARMQAGARAELEKLFRAALSAAGVTVGALTVWSTPRRLALIARDLPAATQSLREEVKGPRTSAPEQALEGFLRKTGLARDQLTMRDGVWFAVLEKEGRATADVLAEAIPAIIRGFSWPKSQRWGAASLSSESLRWVRPLQGIVALLDGDIVACAVDGVASGRETVGHRFHAAGAIAIADADSYAACLRDAHVIVDHAERQRHIAEGAQAAAGAAGLTLVEDEGLVIENAGLTEWPVPLLGRFDAAFLEVPPEVIQLTARINQKYFICRDSAGKLANAFICTANIAAKDGGAGVVDGNRKVLAARLSDARFFWQQDRKVTLADQAAKLARITFHEKLGSVADKVARVAKLADWLAAEGIVPGADPALARQAAELCKADLVTEMVGEFPELQGLMGGYYAVAEGLDPQVADAIRDHYKPVGQGDDVPTAPVTVCVALADKLDTLVGFFAIDEKPTGSKDPFALRRAMISANSIIQKNSLRASFDRMAAIAFEPYFWKSALDSIEDKHFEKYSRHFFWTGLVRNPKDLKFEFTDSKNFAFNYAFNVGGGRVRTVGDYPGFAQRTQFPGIFPAQCIWENVSAGLSAFFADRLKVQQKEAGVRHDLIDAVFALGGEDDLVRLLARVHALQSFIITEDGANLLAGYKRAANILKKETYTPGAANPAPEPAEAALIAALDAAEPRAVAAIAGEDFGAAMAALSSLRASVDRFFEDVTVNDADPALRAARLGLLDRFRAAVHKVADFSRIEG